MANIALFQKIARNGNLDLLKTFKVTETEAKTDDNSAFRYVAQMGHTDVLSI